MITQLRGLLNGFILESRIRARTKCIASISWTWWSQIPPTQWEWNLSYTQPRMQKKMVWVGSGTQPTSLTIKMSGNVSSPTFLTRLTEQIPGSLSGASTSPSLGKPGASQGYYGSYYSLSFEVQFKCTLLSYFIFLIDDLDTVYLAHCYPYTYSD